MRKWFAKKGLFYCNYLESVSWGERGRGGALVLSGNMCGTRALFGKKAKPQIPLSQQAQAEQQRPGPLGHGCLSLSPLSHCLTYRGLALPSLAATVPWHPPVGGQEVDSLGRGLVPGWW